MPRLPHNVNQRRNPIKVVLAVVLGVVFLIVIKAQLGGTTTDQSATQETTAVETTMVTRSVVAQPAAGGKRQTSAPQDAAEGADRWPGSSLEEAIQYDPFAVSKVLATTLKAGSPQTDREQQARLEQLRKQREQILAELRRQGVSVIFRDKTGLAATVNDRIVHEGDLLKGFRVVEIGPNGIVLEPDDNP